MSKKTNIKNQKFPVRESETHNNVIALCSKWRTVPWVQGAYFDWKQSLQRRQCSRWCGSCVFCRCRIYVLSAEPMASISPQPSVQCWTWQLLVRKLHQIF